MSATPKQFKKNPHEVLFAPKFLIRAMRAAYQNIKTIVQGANPCSSDPNVSAKMRFESLEPRILMSADLYPVVQDTILDPQNSTPLNPEVLQLFASPTDAAPTINLDTGDPLNREKTALTPALGAETLKPEDVQPTISWIGDTDGFWDDANNWEDMTTHDHRLPGASDDVLIDRGAENPVITISSGTQIIHSLSSTEALTLEVGSLDMATDSAISGGLILSGGTLILGAGMTLDVSGSFVQSGGILSGTGDLTVAGSATLDGGIQGGAGTTTLQSGGTISGVYYGYFGLDAGRVLRNLGVLNWTGGSIDLNAGPSYGAGRIDNVAGAVFNAQSDDMLYASAYGDEDSVAGFPAFNNAGTFEKTSGTGTTEVRLVFNNSGAVDVQTGTLNLDGGGVGTNASYQGPGTLQFGGGSHNLDADSTLSIANASFSGGTVTVNGTYNVSGTTTINGGTVDLIGALTSIGGELSISGGALNTGGSGFSVASLIQSGGTLSGTGNLTVSGTATLDGGIHSGSGTTTLQNGGTISGVFYGYFGLDGGRVLRNLGVLNWTGGSIDLNVSPADGAGRIDNAAGAVFTAQSDDMLYAGYGDEGSVAGFPVFNNAGTFKKTAGTGTTEVRVVFNNSGTVDIQAGTLNLAGGGNDTGDFTVAAGTILNLSGATHNINGGSVTAPGRVLVNGSATVNVNSAYNIAGTTELQDGMLNFAKTAFTGSLFQSGGTLSGTGTLTVSGSATLDGGIQSGAGTTTLQSGGTISGFFYGYFGLDTGRVLRNMGVLNWTGGYIDLNASPADGAGRIDNVEGAVFNAQSDNMLYAQDYGDVDSAVGFPAFNNAGTFKKTSGTGTTEVRVPFNNSGTVDIQTGTLNLAGGGTDTGDFTVAAGTILNLSGATHNINGGSVTAPGRVLVNGSATVNVNSAYNIAGTTELHDGMLNFAKTAFTGSLIQSGGTLSGIGNLTVSGTATLDGGIQSGAGTTTLQSGGTISGVFNGYFGLDAGRVLQNQGILNWTGGYIDLNASPADRAGRIDNVAGALFNAQSDDTLYAQDYGDVDSAAGFAVFNNAGTFSKTAGTGNTSIYGGFNNTGTVEVSTGTLLLAGNLENFKNNTLTGGTWITVGTLQLGALSLTSDITNAANIELTGASSRLLGQFGADTDVLSKVATNAAGASLTLRNGRNFSRNGAFTNQGALSIGTNTFAIGSYNQTSTGILDVDISGNAATGLFGHLASSGETSLAGTLNVHVAPGLPLSEGDRYGVITFASRSGTFDTFTGLQPAEHQILDPQYSGTSLTLVAQAQTVNHLPVAQNDAVTVHEDQSSVIDALANDSDPDGHALVLSQFSAPAHGQVSLQSNGLLAYTPAADFFGTDSFTYEITDGRGGFASATVTLTIEAVNDQPLARNDGYTTQEDATLTVAAPGLFENDSDSDHDVLNAVLVDGVSHGSLSLQADGGFSYQPAANYFGSDSFTYRVSDGQALSDIATVTLTVTSDNQMPVANNDAFITAEDTSFLLTAAQLLSNDSDPDQEPLSLIAVTQPSYGQLTEYFDGTWRYTPYPDVNGNDAFSYTIGDTRGATASATVVITVTPVNDAPSAANDTAETLQGQAVDIAVLANDTDPDGEVLVITGFTQGNHGTVLALSGGLLRYSPSSGDYSGPDSFS